MDLNEVIKQLTSERDALSAQVERLTPLARRCIWGALVWNDHNFGDLRGCLKEETHKAGILDIDEANEFIAATPQQCLAEIRAEAGRAGYLQALADTEHRIDGYYGTTEEEDNRAADEYAAKVRQGGE